MIYLHCGWPKTGTSSLQAALVNHEDLLASVGIVYPEQWRREADGSHDELLELLRANQGHHAPFTELRTALERYAKRDVLFSGEGLTFWVLEERKHETFLRFIETMQQMDRVKCIWTLRRFDDVLHSFYLQMMHVGVARQSPIRFFENFPVEHLFTGMRAVEDAVAGEVAYVKYDREARHSGKLLRAVGILDDVESVIEQDLMEGSRVNASPTQKELVALLNAKKLSSMFGVDLDKQSLVDAFRRGFRFKKDSPCVVAGARTKRDLHTRALESAQSSGFDPYVRFFGGDDLSELPTTTSMDPEALGEEDLEMLMSYLQQMATA